MPIVEDPVAFAAKSGAINHVGLVLENRLDEKGVFGGVVLQVGILDQDHVARRLLESGPEGSSFAAVYRLVEDPHPGPCLQLVEDLTGPVGAAIVDDQDFL